MLTAARKTCTLREFVMEKQMELYRTYQTVECVNKTSVVLNGTSYVEAASAPRTDNEQVGKEVVRGEFPTEITPEQRITGKPHNGTLVTFACKVSNRAKAIRKDYYFLWE